MSIFQDIDYLMHTLPDGVAIADVADYFWVIVISATAGLASACSDIVDGTLKPKYIINRVIVGIVAGFAISEFSSLMFGGNSWSFIGAIVGGYGGDHIMDKLVNIFEKKIEKAEIPDDQETIKKETSFTRSKIETTTISPPTASVLGTEQSGENEILLV